MSALEGYLAIMDQIETVTDHALRMEMRELAGSASDNATSKDGDGRTEEDWADAWLSSLSMLVSECRNPAVVEMFVRFGLIV